MKPSQIIAGRRYIRRDGKITGSLQQVPHGETNGDTIFCYSTIDGKAMEYAGFVDASGYPWGAERVPMHPAELVQVVTDPRAY